jgi:hypothetical protein
MDTGIIYWSSTGNTEKVAFAIKECLEEWGAKVLFRKVQEARDIDFLEFDLICFGFPSHQWHPPVVVESFLKNKFSEYSKKGHVKLGAPKVPGKHALIFCTYSGPHTGMNEAIPAGKYVGQFFEHLGFNVLDEWYVLGEFHGSEERSTKGKMGDIRGKPSAEELRKVKEDVVNLLKRLNIKH